MVPAADGGRWCLGGEDIVGNRYGRPTEINRAGTTWSPSPTGGNRRIHAVGSAQQVIDHFGQFDQIERLEDEGIDLTGGNLVIVDDVVATAAQQNLGARRAEGEVSGNLEAGNVGHHLIGDDDVELSPHLIHSRAFVESVLARTRWPKRSKKLCNSLTIAGSSSTTRIRRPPIGDERETEFSTAIVTSSGDANSGNRMTKREPPSDGLSTEIDPSRLFDDAVNHRKPQSRTLAHGLGGEIGIEDSRPHVGGNAATGIGHRQKKIIVLMPQDDGDRPFRTADRIDGIQAEVHQNLVKLDRRAQNHRFPVWQFKRHFDIRRHHGANQLIDLVDDLAEIDRRGLGRHLPAECQYLAHQILGPTGGRMNLMHMLGHRFGLSDIAENQVVETENAGQDIVEVVGYSAGQGAIASIFWEWKWTVSVCFLSVTSTLTPT